MYIFNLQTLHAQCKHFKPFQHNLNNQKHLFIQSKLYLSMGKGIGVKIIKPFYLTKRSKYRLLYTLPCLFLKKDSDET